MTMGWVFSGVMWEEGAGGDIVLAWSGVVVLDSGRWGDSLGSLKVTVLTGVTAAMSGTTVGYHTHLHVHTKTTCKSVELPMAYLFSDSSAIGPPPLLWDGRRPYKL